MTLPHSDGRLACGREVQGVLDQVADGRADERDPHQQGCPHCRAALAEYDRLWAPVRDLAAERVEAPDSILEAALEKIRQAVEHTDWGLVPSAEGLVRISARVVVATARQSAQEVPGVRVALSRHLGGPGVAAGATGASTAVEITLAAGYGTDLVALGERVRRTVAARIRELTDLEPADVTVVIDDVLPPR
ncbi:hypothetical protein GCM10017691_02290 [Pseudonocardia petroleophila]|uniref:Asp23/Gls24 family envelope stress response protein n=1 Tax=Pseudonocardia petroleophila TaxID=37331 RepID=A0A7G7ML31_9PSEU|nr:Asp23/Gls24 family envelope stress response protein [Pseudonocardia petroleophila]QNG53492.1 Asp23/Gls24 family envelope stress response protein [Pseudonocardia petroleophila]